MTFPFLPSRQRNDDLVGSSTCKTRRSRPENQRGGLAYVVDIVAPLSFIDDTVHTFTSRRDQHQKHTCKRADVSLPPNAGAHITAARCKKITLRTWSHGDD